MKQSGDDIADFLSTESKRLFDEEAIAMPVSKFFQPDQQGETSYPAQRKFLENKLLPQELIDLFSP